MPDNDCLFEIKDKVIMSMDTMSELLKIIDHRIEARAVIYRHTRPTTLGKSFMESKVMTLPVALENYLGLQLGETRDFNIYFERQKVIGTIRYEDCPTHNPYTQLRLRQLPQNVKEGDQYIIELHKKNDDVEVIFKKE